MCLGVPGLLVERDPPSGDLDSGVVEFAGVRREFLSMPWHGADEHGRAQRFFIWGATAAMLRNLYRMLAA